MKILFMCVANSARSQIAEGLARKYLPDAEIESAGSYPDRLSPFAVTVMEEVGIDISKQYSKSTGDLPPEFINGLDYVITLCAEEVCPAIPSTAKKLRWSLPDPSGFMNEEQILQRFREIRDALQEKLQEFKQEQRQ